MKPQEPSHRPSDSFEDEDVVTLVDVINFFREGWRWIVATPLICIVLGAAYVQFAPSVYEATAHIQMAKVADVPVESPEILSKKLKIPTYFTESTLQACQVPNGQVLVENLKAELSHSTNPTSDLPVRYKARSPEKAKACLSAIFKDIRLNQDVLAQHKQGNFAKQTKAFKEAELNVLKEKLKELIQNSESLSKDKGASALIISFCLNKENLNKDKLKGKEEDKKHPSFIIEDAVLISKYLGSVNNPKVILDYFEWGYQPQIVKLENIIQKKEFELKELPEKEAAHFVAEVYSQDSRVSPRLAPIIMAAALGGLTLGVVFFMFRRAWRKATKK